MNKSETRLLDPVFKPFTSREIKPLGWLKKQLRIQALGLSGNLDKIWPDIRDSKWLGGDREGWERVPYWLDGFIPLAWLLDDPDLKQRAKHYIDRILAAQKPDGWLCPCADEERKDYDIWAFFLICKVLALYADCSEDERIEKALGLALKCLAAHIETSTIFNWAAARWFECLIPIFWLYERTGEEWLLDLAGRLEVQGINYEKLFAYYRDKEPRRKWTYLTHVVNLAMCLKAGALSSRLHGGDPDAFAQDATDKLFQYHGTAAGHFTGDECLAGTSPVQGTELCGVVEAMYSYETLLSVSGNPLWGDYLERLAFNALPATISPDMWTHQYDQMSNQVQCSYLPKDHVVFLTNSGESHLFGLEPNYGCCTANFNQGWPKFALSTFMASKDGIVSSALVPAEVNFEHDGKKIRCRLETEYPFRDTLRYTVETESPVKFALSVRIPGWVKSAKVDGLDARPGTYYQVEREWKGISVVDVSFVFEDELVQRPTGMYCLWRGPLLYSVAPKERWEKHEFSRDGVERKFPYCDYEIFAESPWNYGFYRAKDRAEVLEAPLPDIPFSPENPPIRLRRTMVPVEWKLANGVCEEHPSGKILGEPAALELIPYGCTNLRITEMPLKEPE